MSRWRCQIMLVWAETLWGRKKGAAEEKDSNDPVTFDTVLQMQNGYSSRNLTKRACFDVNWYRQWPVAGSVGCLSVSREAYQMTLKISSTTITWWGGRAQANTSRWVGTLHARDMGRAIWSILFSPPLCAHHENFKGYEWFRWLLSKMVALLKDAISIYLYAYIWRYRYPLPLLRIFCLSLFLSLAEAKPCVQVFHK